MSKVIDLTGRPQSEWYSNPNLLDNWYFADPIDQRQGYVVPPDTPYYSDTGLSTQAGTVAVYTAANYVDGVYGSVTVNGAMYYVDWTAAVRGYVGQGYTIDRWINTNSNTLFLLETDGIFLAGINSEAYMWQLVENPRRFYGKTVTVSVLINHQLYYATGTVPDNVDPDTASNIPIAKIPLSGEVIGLWMTPSGTIFAQASAANGVTNTYQAFKAELGPTQTLVHQDADGNWVLNDPPPNPTLELLKCQRYYQLFSTADARPSNLADYRPSMRVNPALGTININGQTMYFADAYP